MAVSQFLRSDSLIEAVKSYLSPKTIRGASIFLGESETTTQRTFDSAIPSLLGGLTNIASSKDGAANLASMIQNSRSENTLNNVSSVFGGGSITSNMMSTGSELFSRIFGDRGTKVTASVARVSGTSAASAEKILNLMAPVTIGVLAKQIVSSRLSASGLSALLLSQKAEIAAAAPSDFFEILAMRSGPTPIYLGVAHHVDEQERTSGRWWPWLLLLLAIPALIWLLRGRSTNPVTDISRVSTQAAKDAAGSISGTLEKSADSLVKLSLPGRGGISVPRGSINHNLVQYLGDTSSVTPKTFRFDHLNFESNSAQVTAESVPTVGNLSAILKAYPNSQVQLAGYTDNTGDSSSNKTLSLLRADAVKSMLVNFGVSANRISTIGFGQEHPITSNSTEEGRSNNRRTELTVTAK